jgi:hypothetical protein
MNKSNNGHAKIYQKKIVRSNQLLEIEGPELLIKCERLKRYDFLNDILSTKVWNNNNCLVQHIAKANRTFNPCYIFLTVTRVVLQPNDC